jgi:pimeloyl-ACP methyl ester carboxylesterase/GNAT superfamily N-acetyltransferase
MLRLEHRSTIPIAELLTPHSRFVNVAGLQLHYELRGAGPPMVLLHGFAGGAHAWAEAAADLARDHSVYALDLAGFGLSDKPTRADYSLAGHGQRVVGMIEALGLRGVTLAGHSMGGVVAAYAALAEQRGRIARLALLDANFYRRNGPPIPMLPLLPQLLAARFYNPAARAASLRRCFADPSLLTPERIARYLAPTRTPGAQAALAAFLAMPGPATYAELPPQLRLPTLVLWGEADAIWPLADAERLCNELADARLEVVPGAGHMLPEERPGLVAAHLRAFASIGDREQGTGDREQGTGDGEQGTENREQGTGNREQGIGNREQGTGPDPAQISLREAEARDFAHVARLFAALHAFNATLDSRFSLAENWEPLLHEHFLRTHNKPGALWLLAWAATPAGDPHQDEPAGLLVMESHIDSPLFAQRRWAELVALYVAEGQRGSDLGARLVAAGKAWAEQRGFDRIQLYVTAGNTRARRFYARCGLTASQEIWRIDITPQPGVTLPPDPSDHLHPELGSHQLAMELHPHDDHEG